jgi:hypothetical protein
MALRVMQKGFMSATNITMSTSEPPVHVKTVMKGKGDPGYFLAASKSEKAYLLFFWSSGVTLTDCLFCSHDF